MSLVLTFYKGVNHKQIPVISVAFVTRQFNFYRLNNHKGVETKFYGTFIDVSTALELKLFLSYTD
jgi:hypothetical protein